MYLPYGTRRCMDVLTLWNERRRERRRPGWSPSHPVTPASIQPVPFVRDYEKELTGLGIHRRRESISLVDRIGIA